MSFDKNRVLTGTNGRLYVDGEPFGDVQSVSATETLNYEDLNVNGNFVTQHRYTSSSIEGSMTVHKYRSYLLDKYRNVRKTGITPTITATVMLYDPQSQQYQRVALYDVQFTGNDIGSFENATVLTQEMAFNCGDYEILEIIED